MSDYDPRYRIDTSQWWKNWETGGTYQPPTNAQLEEYIRQKGMSTQKPPEYPFYQIIFDGTCYTVYQVDAKPLPLSTMYIPIGQPSRDREELERYAHVFNHLSDPISLKILEDALWD